MSNGDNSLGCFFKGVVIALIVLPFVVHFGLLADMWAEKEGGAISLFLPFWISVSIGVVAKCVTGDSTPVKEDTLFQALVALTIISFIGSTAMLTVFSDDLFGLDEGFGRFALAFMVALMGHILPASLLIVSYKVKKDTKNGSSALPHYYHSRDYDYEEEDEEAEEEPDEYDDTHNWMDDYDMTKDYYGKHGEFDKNDDSWGSSDYVRQFKNNDPDVDLDDHFDWQEQLDAESDGFMEKE